MKRLVLSLLTIALSGLFAPEARAMMVSVPLSGASYTLSDTDYLGTDLVASDANLTTNSSVNVALSNAEIVSGNAYYFHMMYNGLSNGSNYLSVYGGGSATFTLTQPTNSFSLNWGTIDRFNTVQIEDVNHNIYTILGSDILPPNVSGTAESSLSVFFKFMSQADIASIVLSSDSNSFEISNLNVSDVSNVPLPAALPLFGSGLMMLAGFRSKQQKPAGGKQA